MSIYVVGIDCATEQKNIGVALARIDGGSCRIEKAVCCSKTKTATETVAKWCNNEEKKVSLLAIDAPLGWPEKMREVLAMHTAGAFIDVKPDDLFRRKTDLDIEKRPIKRPLEIGAERIARTALSALRLLNDLRIQLPKEIPLAWEMGEPSELCAIEVYPAATWLTLREAIPKIEGDTKGDEKRKRMIASLSGVDGFDMSDPDVTGQALDSNHVLDAILCTLAAREFIAGRCVPPTDVALAKKEGWTWTGSQLYSEQIKKP